MKRNGPRHENRTPEDYRNDYFDNEVYPRMPQPATDDLIAMVSELTGLPRTHVQREVCQWCVTGSLEDRVAAYGQQFVKANGGKCND
jgi:hypothetical protein